MTLKTKRVLTEILKYKVYKLHETYLKEEFPCIYRKFLLRQVRQNTFSYSVENVKSKGGGGGEGLCRTYSIAFLVSGCREPILLIAAMFLASKITASASSRYSKAQWLCTTAGRREYVHCTRKIAES